MTKHEYDVAIRTLQASQYRKLVMQLYYSNGGNMPGAKAEAYSRVYIKEGK